MSRKMVHEEFMRRLHERNEFIRSGEIEIIGEYDGLEKRLEYLCHRCNTVQNPVAASLMAGCGCKKCGIQRTAASQKKSHETFVKELYDVNKNITPLGEYVNRYTKIDFMCEKGHIWNSSPMSILTNGNCPVCLGKQVLVGFNDIATTSPDIFEYLADKEDGYKYTRWSNKRADFKCTLCGHVQNRKIASIAHRGFKCENCSNGISYPNKFGRAFFDQLSLSKYIAEYSPEWAKPYVYDIYFKLDEKEYIVEWDGCQHFRENGSFGVDFEEYQKTDKIKDDLANNNGVVLIRVNCSVSDPEYIRNNIEKSKLGILFDLSNIDWSVCDERAQRNIVKDVCDMWTSGVKSFDEISKRFHLGNSTVRDYINRGTRIGWCYYNPRDYLVSQCHKFSIKRISDGEEFTFESLKDCATATMNICGHRIAEETIRKYSQNGLPYNGLIFERIYDTIQN